MVNREYKIVILGTGHVGKSAILRRFFEGIFIKRYDPIHEDLPPQTLKIDGNNYTLSINDRSSRYCETHEMREEYMKSAHGFILVYSITAQSSLINLEQIYDEIVRYRETNDVPIVLVGNKCDLESERIVSQEDGKAFAEKWNAEFLEVSAKDEIRVNDIFTTLIKKMDEKYIIPQQNGCILQ